MTQTPAIERTSLGVAAAKKKKQYMSCVTGSQMAVSENRGMPVLSICGCFNRENDD